MALLDRDIDRGEVLSERSFASRVGGGEADVLAEHGRAEGVADACVVLVDRSAFEAEPGAVGRGAAGEDGGEGDGGADDGGLACVLAGRVPHDDSSVRVDGLSPGVVIVSARAGGEEPGVGCGVGAIPGRRDRYAGYDRDPGVGVSEFPDGLYDGGLPFSVVPGVVSWCAGA